METTRRGVSVTFLIVIVFIAIVIALGASATFKRTVPNDNEATYSTEVSTPTSPRQNECVGPGLPCEAPLTSMCENGVWTCIQPEFY
jgi:hypothetical protein